MSNFMNGLEACAIQAQSLNETVYTYTPIQQLVSTNIWGRSVTVSYSDQELSHVLNASQVTTAIVSSDSLMSNIPNLYKLVSDNASMVIHVSAGMRDRDSFADFSQVMSVRQSGLALLSASTVQEAHDFAFLAQWVSLLTGTPFLHFFDSKRISHEYCTVELRDKETLLKLLPDNLYGKTSLQSKNKLAAETEKGQNGLDIFDTLNNVMDQFATVTGKRYAPLEYTGHTEAEFVIVASGAGASAVEHTLNDILEADPNKRFGVLKIRLYRPWSKKHFLDSLPITARRIAILEPVDDYTSTWNPLFLDVVSTYQAANNNTTDLFSGCYGIDKTDFSPAEVSAVYDELVSDTLNSHFKTSDLSQSSHLFKTPTSLNTEQIIFIGNPSFARAFASTSTRYAQVYSIGDISHVRTSATENSFPPSLIQHAGAVVLDTLPIAPQTEQAAVQSIMRLDIGGYLIVDFSCDLEYAFSPEAKKAAYSRQAKILCVEDIFQTLQGPLSKLLNSSKCMLKTVSADWNNSSTLSSTEELSVTKIQDVRKGRGVDTIVETPYIKALEQVFGNHLFIANAYGTASVWSSVESHANATTPEFGYGILINQLQKRARFVDEVIEVIRESSSVPTDAIRILSRWLMLVNSPHASPQKVNDTADLVVQLISFFPTLSENRHLLYSKSNWLIGSDTWAQDLGQSGLHHVITSGDNINILIIDTCPYTGHVDKERRKKDIGLYAMNCGSVYVASVAIYASYTGVLNALMEADAYNGPSVVIAYLPQLTAVPNPLETLKETKICVDNGSWPLYRWNPALEDTIQDMFTLDSQRIKRDLETFLSRENYLTQVISQQPDISDMLVSSLEKDIKKRHIELKSKAHADYARLLSGLSSGCYTNQPLTILFGSDNGNGEGVAKKIATGAKARGIQVKLMAMDDYGDVKCLADEFNVVLICSTAGQGEMPTNSREFWKALNGSVKGDLNLSEVNVGVFGLGDSHYWPRKEDAIFYNRPGKMLDAKFEALGACKLVGLGLGDDQDEDGFETGFSAWILELWKALGVQNVQEEPTPIYTDDQMKIDSNFLRGNIAEDLVDSSTSTVSETSQKLLQFHGTHLQDDRDLREGREKQGLEKAYSFMVRVRTPCGIATPKQWLAIDNLSTKFGNNTMKLTTRQTFQLHGIMKKKLRTTIRSINKVLLSTLAACGDVSRNIMCTSITEVPEVLSQVQGVVKELVSLLTPKTTAYHEIWLDNSMVAGHAVQDFEPIYGSSYLPRKFKIAIAIPPNNDVDVYAHDLGYIAIVNSATKKVTGYNVLIGGGMGHKHGNATTYPRSATIIGYIPANAIVDVTQSVVLIQRDYGNRVGRTRARFKYTVDTLGIDFIKKEIEERSGYKLEEARLFHFSDNLDRYGWTKGAGDTWNFGMYIENGRVKDTPEFLCKTGLRELAKFHKGEFRLTANQHLIICNVPEVDLDRTKAHLAKYKMDNLSFSNIRMNSMACVALPTCGLALAESERYLPDLITLLEDIMEESGIRDDSITIRMTGCSSGCARPYLAELAFVGKSPNTYDIYLGGSPNGQRLNKLFKEDLQEVEFLQEMRSIIKKYAVERSDEEAFGDWVIRAGYV